MWKFKETIMMKKIKITHLVTWRAPHTLTPTHRFHSSISPSTKLKLSFSSHHITACQHRSWGTLVTGLLQTLRWQVYKSPASTCAAGAHRRHCWPHSPPRQGSGPPPAPATLSPRARLNKISSEECIRSIHSPVMSQGTTRALPPLATISFLTASSLSTDLATSTTLHPTPAEECGNDNNCSWQYKLTIIGDKNGKKKDRIDTDTHPAAWQCDSRDHSWHLSLHKLWK